MIKSHDNKYHQCIISPQKRLSNTPFILCWTVTHFQWPVPSLFLFILIFHTWTSFCLWISLFEFVKQEIGELKESFGQPLASGVLITEISPEERQKVSDETEDYLLVLYQWYVESLMSSPSCITLFN